MNKLLTKAAKLLLGLSLAAGVGVAIGSKAAERVDAAASSSSTAPTNATWSYTFASGDLPVAGATKTFNNVSWTYSGDTHGSNTYVGFDNTKGVQLGKGTANYGATTDMTLTAAVSAFGSNKKVTKMAIGLACASSGGYSGSFSNGDTISSSTTSVLYWTSSTMNVSSGNIVFTFKSTNSAKAIYAKAIYVWYENAGSGNVLDAPSPTFNRSNNTITWGAVTNATSYQIKIDSGTYATATSGYSVASVSVNDAHTVYVKALADGYTAAEGSVTFHRYATKGTATDPYTIADARRAIDDNEGLSDVYAQGIVSAIPTAYNSQYSNITFNIVDAFGDTDFIQAFRCTGTDAADVAINDTALVSGTLKKYNSTYEFDTGCVLEELTHPVVSTTWTITFNSDGGTDPDDIEVGDGLTFNFPSPGTKANYVFTGWSNDSGVTFHQEGEASDLIDDDDMYVGYWQSKGTQNNPYTIAEARTAITNNAGVKGVFVQGIVSAIPTAYNSQYSNITFNLVDSLNDSDFLQAYRCTGTDAADVAVGDTALVSGDLMLHSGTYEFASGCVLVTLSAPTVSSLEITGTLTNSSYLTNGAWDPTGLTVTATYSNSSTADVTSSVTWTYSPATPATMGVGDNQNLTITAEFSGESDDIVVQVSVSSAPVFTLVTDPSDLTSGTTFIFVASSTSTKAMVQNRTTSNGASGVADVTLSNEFNSGSVATSTNATVFTLGGSTGAWTIKNGDNQLGFTGSSNNNMQFNENQTDTFKITTQSGYLLSVESNAQSGRKLQYNHNNGSPRFSNYNGGQTYIYMFAMIAEASFGETDHISISTMPETEFAVGETFNSVGLSILAWDGVDQSTANSKLVNATSISLAGTTFSDTDIGSNEVTVVYTENGNNFTTSYNIYVYASASYQLVTEQPSGGWAGTYLITSEVASATTAVPETGTYAMKSSLVNFDVVGNYAKVTPVTENGVTTIVAGQHLQFSIAALDGGYSIQGHSGKYIGWNNSSNNGLTTSNSALVNTISINNGDVEILCSAGTKGLSLNTTSGQFRYYSNPSVKLYKLVESSEALDYAEEFLDMLSTGSNPVCQVTAQGVVETDLEDLKVAWAILASDFDSLSTNAIKQQFTQGTADEASEDKISQALALYDHIATVYGENLESQDCSEFDFMGRNITPIGGARLALGNIIESTNTIAIIVIISMVSVTAIGGYFFIKRRKVN